MGFGSRMGCGDHGTMAQPSQGTGALGRCRHPVPLLRAENGQHSSLECMDRNQDRTGSPHCLLQASVGPGDKKCPQTPWVPGGREGNGCRSTPSLHFQAAPPALWTWLERRAASARSESRLPGEEARSKVFLLKATPTQCHGGIRPLPRTRRSMGRANPSLHRAGHGWQHVSPSFFPSRTRFPGTSED